jgi:Ca-activated chloride channel family protein
MFRFANPYLLYVLLLIPVLSVIFYITRRARQKAIAQIGDQSLMQQLMPDASDARPVIKFVMLMLILASVTLGLARPQFGSRLQEVKRKGIEIMIALDVSNSMNAQDIQPSRLQRSKQAIAKLVEKLNDDRIGLVVFAGDAYTQIPITTDYVSAKMFLNNISTGIVPVQGTAIGKAIEQSIRSFPANSELQKAIIIITDGENHEDNPVEMAKLAADKGILVFTLGMGLPEGAPIPLGAENAQNFKKDQSGQVVISKLDETTLQQIAAAGGGMYVRANNTQAGLNTLFDRINSLSRKEYDSKIYSDYDDQFQYFFAFALIILIADFILLERKNKWLKGFKVFDVNKMGI